MRIGALLLAAGESSRLGIPKQLLRDTTGRPLVASVVHALHAAGCDPIVVVLGAHADGVAHALIHDAPNVHLVPNRAWAEGMGSSIRAGIAAMSTHTMMRDVDAVLISACDMPSADRAHFVALRDAAAAAMTPTGALVRVASEYSARVDVADPSPGGADDRARVTRGIPAIVPRADWPALLSLSGDRGAKGLLRGDDTLTVRLAHGSFDLDTPADVAAWRASASDQRVAD